MKSGKPLQVIGGLAIAAAGLAVFFRNVDVGKLGRELAGIGAWVVVLNAAMQVLTLWLRSLRLRLLLPVSPTAHAGGLFSNVAIGFMLNNIFPARVGEAARVVLLWRQNKYRPFEGLGALVVERIWDVVALIGFFAVPVFLLPPLGGLRNVALLFGLGCCAWFALLAGHAAFPHVVMRILTTLTRALPHRLRLRVDRMMRELLSSLDWVRSVGRFAAIAALTLALELCYAVGLAALIGGAALDAGLKALFVQSLGSLGAAIPLSPGYVGTLHAFMLQGLTMVDVAGERARAIAIVFHACGYITVTLLGLVLMMKMKMSLGEMSKANVDIPQTDEHPSTDRTPS